MQTAPNTWPNQGLPAPFPHPQCTAWGEDTYGLWMAFDFAGAEHLFRWIPPGQFWMGSPRGEKGRYDDEDRHAVTLAQGFWLGETAVTQTQWQALAGNNPSHFKGEQRPVEQVSWLDAKEYIAKLNKNLAGLSACLPTEAQWEYACRAGTQTPFSFGEELTLAKANYSGDWEKHDKKLKGETKDVKAFAPNPWGLYQMHGNVWEWCADAWQKNLGKAGQVDPMTGGADEAIRVVRGGSWSYRGRDLRSASRAGHGQPFRSRDFGFRLALVKSPAREAEPTVKSGGAGPSRSDAKNFQD